MKKCLKRLLQCSIVLLLLNCQSEDLAIDNHEYSKLRIQRISLEDLKLKPKAFESLNAIKEKGKTDAQAKLVFNSLYDFYVDTEEIVYIEKEETHSYTFAVYRKENTAYFENLVMTQQEDGSYSSTLVSYNLTEQEKYDLDHEQLYSLDGKMSASVLNAGSIDNELLMNRTSCTTIQIPTCSYDHTHFAGANCTKIDGSIDITICTDISEPHAPISYISPGGSGGSSGGGGGGSPSTQTPIASNPTPEPTVLPDSQSPINNIGNITVPLIKPSPIERFMASLTDEQEDWLNTHATIKAIITNYVSQNTQDFPFAENLIENCMDNNLNNEDSKEYVVSNIIEEKIDDTQLDECTKGILNKLKTLQQNDIAKIIRRFDVPESEPNLSFSQVPNLMHGNQIAYGKCIPTNTDLTYNIQLNSNFYKDDGATNLGKAGTIVHEIMHALIASVAQNYYPNTDSTDFPAIWNAYVNIKTGGTAPDDHIFMGNHYINIMGAILQEYDTGVSVPDGQTPQQLYTDLAWQGLFTDLSPTTPFDSVLTNTDIIRIWARKQAEMTNEYTNGIHPTNNPPCLN